MVARFIASSPTDQNTETYRQFQRLQGYLANLEERLAPLYGGGQVTPLILTDAYQVLTLVEPLAFPIPDQAGIYFLSLRLSVTGSTANSEVQLRITSGGEVIEGNIITIGNNALEAITLTGTLPIRRGGITLEARGTTAEVLDGRFDIHRVGAGP